MVQHHTEPERFQLGGAVLRMLVLATVASFALCGLFLYSSLARDTSQWGAVAFSFACGLILLGACVVTPGVLTISDEGIQIERRHGSQRLRWSDVTRARWKGHGAGAVGLMARGASDNWQAWIEGTAEGKPVTIVLTGPGVERQARVRELLAARLPRGRE